jgi:hypothetical protein
MKKVLVLSMTDSDNYKSILCAFESEEYPTAERIEAALVKTVSDYITDEVERRRLAGEIQTKMQGESGDYEFDLVYAHVL